MGAILRLLAVLSVLVPTHAFSQQWIEFRPEEVNYSISMPGEWSMQAQDIETKVGKLKMQIATVDLGKRAYMTAYMRYPDEVLKASNMSKLLDGVRDGAVGNLKGKVRKEERIVISNRSAREVVADAPQGIVAVMRFFMLDNFLIQALVIGDSSLETDPDTARFLGSLKVR
jgi:hypothetical protein